MTDYTWYHIKDALPFKEEFVVILLNNGVPLVAKFNGFEFTDDNLEVENVTHWMPLPSKPVKIETGA